MELPPSPPTAAPLTTDDLLKVLVDHGAEFPLLEIRGCTGPDDEERGVYVRTSPDDTSPVPMGTAVLRIPWHMLITVEVAQRESEFGRRLRAAEEAPDGVGLDIAAASHGYIAAFLLEDRKFNYPTSRFSAYYDTLPQRLPHLPLFWAESELRALLGTSFVFQQVVDRLAALRHDYDATSRAIASTATTAGEACIRYIASFADVATFEEYCWARSIIASRNFGLDVPVPAPPASPLKKASRKRGSSPGPRTVTQTALVPFGDMLNHARPRRTRWAYAPAPAPPPSSSNPGHFAMTAERPLARGSEVLGSYGHKSNARYLLNYGFTFPTNVLTPADVRPAFADAVGEGGGGTGGGGVGELRCLDEVRLFFQLDLDDPHYTLKVTPCHPSL